MLQLRRPIFAFLGLLSACSGDTPAPGPGDVWLTGPVDGTTGATADGGGTGSATGGTGGGVTARGGTTGPSNGSTGTPIPGEPVSLDACAPGATPLSDAQVATLRTGGPSIGARLLYPYDGTAFPRGIGAPMFMWDGVSGVDGVLVHIKSREFEYYGCLVPSAEGQLQLPEDVWTSAGQKTYGKSDPYSVELTFLAGGTAVGPVSQQWLIAQATIKGSVYYNSYTPVGQVYRIPPGGQAERFGSIECNGCHSVSANGERMTVQTVLTGGRTYDISSGQQQQLAAPISTPYAALTPDGRKYVSNSLQIEVARSVTASLTALGKTDSQLHETATGQVIPSSGIPGGALMPSFSPDGQFLVFNDNAMDGAQGLAIVQWDDANDAATGYQKLYQDDDALMRPGWPFVLPDNGAVVFVNTRGGNFSADGAGVAGIGGALGPYSELFMVDVDTGDATILAKAMGYATANDASAQKTYLPFGGEDITRAYFPTVSPVAAGGYFWVFFDAVRHYGNMGQSRQLWGTAIEISPDGDYSVDRSHPAFYLPGQVFGTGNHRAFTALDPCKQDGDGCASGVDCCGGYCVIPEQVELVDLPGTCASEIETCSAYDERCTVSGDCCQADTGALTACINGFCAPVPLL